MESIDLIKPIEAQDPKVAVDAERNRQTDLDKQQVKEDREEKAAIAGDKKREEKEPSITLERDEVEAIASSIDSYLKSIQTDLEIDVHEDSGRVMAKIIRKDSGELIKEIPPEKLLDIAAKMKEIVGVLFDANV